MFKRSTITFEVGDMFTGRICDQPCLYKITSKRYKSGMKYKLSITDKEFWGSPTKWMTATAVLREFTPSKLGKYLYV